jgi:hypothetical protein
VLAAVLQTRSRHDRDFLWGYTSGIYVDLDVDPKVPLMSRPDFLYLSNAEKFQNYPDLGCNELNYIASVDRCIYLLGRLAVTLRCES